MGMTSDAITTFEEFKTRIRLFAEEREWPQFHTPKNLSMALAAEAAELMEHFLWLDSSQSRNLVDDPVKGPKVREEIADILIYALEFANVTGIDLAKAIEDKIRINGIKYPVEKCKGSSKKYNEL
ncbi:MAG: nucleotide pyrophosphohydrolase [Opitutales bacterium]|nr:nucleotide pyrophosphohydrolase [Opitutales bacterium]